MNFNINKRSILIFALPALMMSMSSCIGDLDVDPTIDKSTVMSFDKDKNFRKLYANMALTGQIGPAGSGDISDIDEGASDFFRNIWNMNELPTDEAICNWNDPGLPEYNKSTWGSNHGMIKAGYYRLVYGITLVNEFLKKTDGMDDETKMQIAEARFLRALNYSYEMDLFGKVTFVKSINETPVEYSREDIFNFIEKELKECVENMAEPRKNTYGRADKAAAWLLLSRIYLNAEVYTGTPRWKEASEYAEKVIKSGYKLCPNYPYLFMGDNNSNGAEKEIILPIIQDGEQTQTYGGTLFLIASTHSTDMPATGTSQNWSGNRAQPELVKKFFEATDAPEVGVEDMIKQAKDQRALFYGKGRKLNIEEIGTFTDGFSVAKFSNIYSNGKQAKDVVFVDTDIPFMRLAEAYLNIAEAELRLGNKDKAKKYIDQIKDRAQADKLPEYDLETICDEWAREFYFEGRRRSDLIRFGKFGGNTTYKWQFKGGAVEGAQIPEYRNVFPIPEDFIIANNNLTQNVGY